MQTNLASILAMQHGSIQTPYHRLPVKARVRDRGIDYCVHHCDRNGAALHRMDETDATVTYSQVDIAEALNRPDNPMTVEKGYYDETRAKSRIAGADTLSALNPREQEDVIMKEFFVRDFFRMKAEYREQCRLARIDGMPLPLAVSKTRESLLRIIPVIARRWRDLQVGNSKATYRMTRAVRLEEPSPSTLKRWIRTMEEHEFNALSLRNKYRGERPEHFTPDELIHLNTAVASACSQTDPDLADIHRVMVKAMEAENTMRNADEQLRIPCENTLRARYSDLPEMKRDLARDGKNTAKRKWQPEFGGIDVVRAGERVEIDDHETDLQTLLAKIGVWKMMSKSERAKVKRVRLWISAAIDVASRSLLALHVSSQPPSIKSAMTVLEMATRDKSDIARRLGCKSRWEQNCTIETVAVDSATYFTNRQFRVAVNDMGTDLFLPPAGEANWRGFVERLFGTYSHQMFNYYSGRTWSSPEEKGDYDAEAFAAAVADQVAECSIRWAVDAYHNAPHTELNEATPCDRWLELSRDYGVMPGPTGALRTHLFGTYIKRTISKKGIRIAGLYYQSKELQKIRRKLKSTPVVGRVNNHNLGAASVWTDGGWIEVPCMHKELDGVTIWQWLATVERLRLFNTENAKVSRETMMATFVWLKQQAEMAWLESGLVSPILTDEDYVRFEKSMDHLFDIVDKPLEGELRPEGEWHPSDQLFTALGIQPVVYAKTKKSVKEMQEEAEAGGRPQIGTMPTQQPAPTPAAEVTNNDELTVVSRISNDIFNEE